jgi:RimJ/RimL family protein N-acetyltransferase
MNGGPLRRHLAAWLGGWPPRRSLDVVGHPGRLRPGWDGRIYPALGVAAPEGGVLSVPPARAGEAAELAGRPLDEVIEALPAAIDRPELVGYRAIFRWSLDPAPLPEAGVWEPADAPSVPKWLRVFGGEVLLARDPDTGDYLAGVGVKRHDGGGGELAVGTEPAARGRSLARRLVAQAARRILDEGGVPTYQHDPANIASARVAEAAGFPDRGWVSFGVSERFTPDSDQTSR